LNLVDRDRALGRAIIAGRPEIWAEVVHAVEREMALRLADVLIRRVHLFYEDAGHGTSAAPPVARRMAELLGWDQARETEEIADYLSVVKRSREFLAGVPRASKTR
jgi:glycerol-3-phosphate dehydrogenase